MLLTVIYNMINKNGECNAELYHKADTPPKNHEGSPNENIYILQ